MKLVIIFRAAVIYIYYFKINDAVKCFHETFFIIYNIEVIAHTFFRSFFSVVNLMYARKHI